MANKKLKLLYLARYLREQTDEQHPKTMQDMIAYLAGCGISAERKSLYDDLELLRVYGMDVQSVKGKSFGYFLGERDFQLPELKLLIDVVQASPFLTQSKSMALIGKLERLTSRPNARQLSGRSSVTTAPPCWQNTSKQSPAGCSSACGALPRLHRGVQRDALAAHLYPVDANGAGVLLRGAEAHAVHSALHGDAAAEQRREPADVAQQIADDGDGEIRLQIVKKLVHAVFLLRLSCIFPVIPSGVCISFVSV